MLCWNFVWNEIIHISMFITCSQVLLVTAIFALKKNKHTKNSAVLNPEHLFKQTNFILIWISFKVF